jgi:hypothetical protein
MDKPIWELDYMEVQVQRQLLEHIADKGPLSQGNLARNHRCRIVSLAGKSNGVPIDLRACT